MPSIEQVRRTRQKRIATVVRYINTEVELGHYKHLISVVAEEEALEHLTSAVAALAGNMTVHAWRELIARG